MSALNVRQPSEFGPQNYPHYLENPFSKLSPHITISVTNFEMHYRCHHDLSRILSYMFVMFVFIIEKVLQLCFWGLLQYIVGSFHRCKNQFSCSEYSLTSWNTSGENYKMCLFSHIKSGLQACEQTLIPPKYLSLTY